MGTRIPIVADIPQADPRMGFSEYADALSDAVRGGNPPQFTIGIYGAWGSGKSSLLNAISQNLSKAGDVIPVFFDAWRYERYEYIVVPLVHAIYRETRKLQNPRIADQIKQALTSIVYSLNFKLGVAELDMDKLRQASESTDLIPLDNAFAKPFEDLRKLPDVLEGQRIAVLIDDLDRCSPENVVAVLESINLILDIPGFIFVLALDYDVLVKAVGYKYPHVSGHILIEKMVQVPFRVPRLDLEPEMFARDLIPEWSEHQAEFPRDFLNYAVDIASLGLQANPRQIKRFINSFLVLRRIIHQRGLNANDTTLAALIGLQLRWPEQYRDLSDAVYAGDQEATSLLLNDDEPALQAYAQRFFSGDLPGDDLRVLLQFTEAVATHKAAPPEDESRPPTAMDELREKNRQAFIAGIQERGFAKSSRSERFYYHPDMPNVRFVIGELYIRFEKKGKEGFKLWESYLITREIDLALAVISEPDKHFSNRG